MGSRCWSRARGRPAPLAWAFAWAFNFLARSASAARSFSASLCLCFSAGRRALVCDHWCSTSATSACFWSRSALRRSRCSSKSSMCSPRLAFSWPSVTQRTRSASRRVSARSDSSAAQRSTASCAAAPARCTSVCASSTRAQARLTAPSSFTLRRCSRRSWPRRAASTSPTAESRAASRSILAVSMASMRAPRAAWCSCMAPRILRSTPPSSPSIFAVAPMHSAISATIDARSEESAPRSTRERPATISGAAADQKRPMASVASCGSAACFSKSASIVPRRPL
mmetsp:Transcript_19093/g.64492  ORF Transcript_19093/g.64492 Transcript_19093/m.64492 type:complete len:283 (+) Transcript_19093:173-1021(+)